LSAIDAFSAETNVFDTADLHESPKFPEFLRKTQVPWLAEEMLKTNLLSIFSFPNIAQRRAIWC
jgi:hypothetical protein